MQQVRSQYSEAQLAIRTLSSQTEDASHQTGSLQSRLEQFAEELRATQQELRQARQATDDAHDNVRVVELAKQELQTKLRDLTASHTILFDRVAEAQQFVSSMVQRLDSVFQRTAATSDDQSRTLALAKQQGSPTDGHTANVASATLLALLRQVEVRQAHVISAASQHEATCEELRGEEGITRRSLLGLHDLYRTLFRSCRDRAGQVIGRAQAPRAPGGATVAELRSIVETAFLGAAIGEDKPDGDDVASVQYMVEALLDDWMDKVSELRAAATLQQEHTAHMQAALTKVSRLQGELERLNEELSHQRDQRRAAEEKCSEAQHAQSVSDQRAAAAADEADEAIASARHHQLQLDTFTQRLQQEQERTAELAAQVEALEASNEEVCSLKHAMGDRCDMTTRVWFSSTSRFTFHFRGCAIKQHTRTVCDGIACSGYLCVSDLACTLRGLALTSFGLSANITDISKLR